MQLLYMLGSIGMSGPHNRPFVGRALVNTRMRLVIITEDCTMPQVHCTAASHIVPFQLTALVLVVARGSITH